MFVKVEYLGFYPMGSDVILQNIKIMQEPWNVYKYPTICVGKSKEVSPLCGQVFYVTKGEQTVFFVAIEYGLSKYHVFTISGKTQKRLIKRIKTNRTREDITKKSIFSDLTLLTPSGKIVVPAKLEYDDGDTAKPISKITITYNETEYRGFGTDWLWTDTFANLQKKLPDDVIVACCMTCKHGNMCPYGNEENQLFCMKDIVVESKMNLCDIFDNVLDKDDEYEKRTVTSFGYCDDFAYQSDDYYTYNDYLYPLYKSVSREEAYYYYILLSNGFTDGYDKWLNSYLEAQTPLSDIVLNLSFCGNDVNSTISYLYSYAKEYNRLNEEVVCCLLREFLRIGYLKNRFTKDEVCRLMYKFATTHGDPGEFDGDIWDDMFYMDGYYSFAKDGSISMKKFDELFFGYLYNGTKIPPLH